MECPACGHTWSTAKQPHVLEPLNQDTSLMSEADMRAYYKRTALRADAAFHLQFPLSDEQRVGYEAIVAGTITGAAGRQAYERLNDVRRMADFLDQPAQIIGG